VPKNLDDDKISMRRAKIMAFLVIATILTLTAVSLYLIFSALG
jgi:hypothetical protein